MALTESLPRRWPESRSRPRPCAQRPLPSMMMATCRGRRVRSIPCASSRARRDFSSFGISTSNRHDLVFFGLEDLVDLDDAGVGERLHLVVGVPEVVLGDVLLLQELLQHVVRIAPVIA